MTFLEIEPGVFVQPDLVTQVRGLTWGADQDGGSIGYSVFVTFLAGADAMARQRSWSESERPPTAQVAAEAAREAREVAALIDEHRSRAPVTVVRA